MERFEKLLDNYIDQLPESRVREAMRYSLLAGGKRIRPLLLYTALQGYGVNEEKGDPFAAALEMIHTYSLIHDDLPAMDNDDLRRGRPTCHKQFDEATAILAGDGLLTYAFEVASSADADDHTRLACVNVLARMAGAGGMVLGQDLDMNEIEGITAWEDLKRIHHNKTGCLLSAPLMMACVIADHEADMEKWHELGEKLGLAFQVQDDIMDIRLTPEQFGKSTSDENNDKVTSVRLLGIDEAEYLMNRLYEECMKMADTFSGFDSRALKDLIEKIKTRTN
ncbi:MAG: polyprenyl synthetase family protein [Erysipelotrichaceae bacterium]|nr:polyprenyl synthetase family protein [Erysipelotrichaceae bacterium]